MLYTYKVQVLLYIFLLKIAVHYFIAPTRFDLLRIVLVVSFGLNYTSKENLIIVFFVVCVRLLDKQFKEDSKQCPGRSPGGATASDSRWSPAATGFTRQPGAGKQLLQS